MAKPFEPPRAFRLRRRTHWLIPTIASIQMAAQGISSAVHREWFDTVLWFVVAALMGFFAAKVETLKRNQGGWVR